VFESPGSAWRKKKMKKLVIAFLIMFSAPAWCEGIYNLVGQARVDMLKWSLDRSIGDTQFGTINKVLLRRYGLPVVDTIAIIPKAGVTIVTIKYTYAMAVNLEMSFAFAARIEGDKMTKYVTFMKIMDGETVVRESSDNTANIDLLAIYYDAIQ
jgi:hypothetical protein